MILVTGATVNFGRNTVEQLHEAGHPVRALTRDPGKANLPPGVQVVRGDLTDPATLPPVLEDVTAVFLVLPYELDVSPFLQLARNAGVRRIVFLSSGAVVDGAAEQPTAIAAYHAGVEAAIKESGMEWTFVRLMFPAINSLSWAGQLAEGDAVRAPYGKATSAPIHEADVAAVAVTVLTTDGHSGAVYEPTGPQTLTQIEQVRIIGEVLGRELTFEDQDPEPVKRMLGRFMDAGMLDSLFSLMAASVETPAPVTSVVEELTGRRPGTYAQWVADHAGDFG